VRSFVLEISDDRVANGTFVALANLPCFGLANYLSSVRVNRFSLDCELSLSALTELSF